MLGDVRVYETLRFYDYYNLFAVNINLFTEIIQNLTKDKL